MKIKYIKRFIKDLKALQSTDVYEKISALVLVEIPEALDLSTIGNL
jgi:hypothetical protein